MQDMIQLQMQEYRNEIKTLQEELSTWVKMQSAILDFGASLVSGGKTMSFDGVCDFVINDSSGSQIYKGDRWDEALKIMAAAEPDSIQIQKTPQQLEAEFTALTDDSERWRWLPKNQSDTYTLHLNSGYAIVTFEELKSYVKFDKYIRWTEGALILLAAMGIKAEFVCH